MWPSGGVGLSLGTLDRSTHRRDAGNGPEFLLQRLDTVGQTAGDFFIVPPVIRIAVGFEPQ